MCASKDDKKVVLWKPQRSRTPTRLPSNKMMAGHASFTHAPFGVASKNQKNKQTNQRARSSSRRRAKMPGLGKTLKHHAGKAAGWIWDEVVKRIFGQAQPLVTRKNQIAAQIKLAQKDQEQEGKTMTSYFSTSKTSVDTKALSKEHDLLDHTIGMYKQMMKSAVGMAPIRIVLPVGLNAYMTATVTTGIVNNTNVIRPSDTTEFATLIALFDEYKMTGLTIKHSSNLIRQGIAVGTSLDGAYRVTAIDASDGNALANANAGLQYATHELLPLNAVACTKASMHEIRVSFPKATLLDSTGNITFAQDTWLNANPSGTPLIPIFCVVKHYTIQSVVTADVVESAALFYDMHFRLRE